MKNKVNLNPGCVLSPLPTVMVSLSSGGEDNIITIAWTGIINSEPPMTYISVRPSRHSYAMLKESREFVINLTSEELVYAMDHCGVATGAREDKFKEMHLTKMKADIVSCPMIAESPINLECKVTDIVPLGSHGMFIAEIVAVHADEDLMEESGHLAFEKAHLVSYVHGDYYGVKGRRLGTYGYTAMKKRTAKRRRAEGKPASGAAPHWKKD